MNESLRQYASATCGDLRRDTFIKALDLGSHAKTIVETGTVRTAGPLFPDGASTLLFANVAKETGAKFFSIEKNPEHIRACMEALGPELVNHVKFMEGDSVDGLSHFPPRSIDLLYLDSFDYEFHEPLKAQMHNLAEVGAALGKMAKRSVILIDDCNIEGGGKGKLSSEFLLSRGWNLVVDAYQKLFINFVI